MKKIWTFFLEAKEELKKVSWPTKDEVSKYTFVTVITLAFMACFLLLVDSVLGKLLELVR